jgi:hypothetical protein
VLGSTGGGFIADICQNLTENTGGFFRSVLTASAVPDLMKTAAAYVAADQ